MDVAMADAAAAPNFGLNHHTAPALAHDALPPLPLALVLSIVARLPVDQRLLLALVSRSFRAAAGEASLYLEVDLSPASGVAQPTGGLLLAASARARGGMRALDVTHRVDDDPAAPHVTLPWAALVAVVAANAGSLRTVVALSPLHSGLMNFWSIPTTQQPHLGDLLAAAGAGVDIHIDIWAATWPQARAVLSRAPPYGALRVRRLVIEGPLEGAGGDGDGPRALAAALAASLTARELLLRAAPLHAPGDAGCLADALIGRRCTALRLEGAALPPAACGPLARLVACAPLETLWIDNVGGPALLAGGELLAALCGALRSTRALATLALTSCGLWDDPGRGAALLAALTGHPTVARLLLFGNVPEPDAARAAGEALARLLAPPPPQPPPGSAGAPGCALTSLDVSFCFLGDAGLGPLLRALPGPRCHLARLCCEANAATPRLAEAVLLPCAQRCPSLLELRADGHPSLPALARAEAMVTARAAAAGGGGGGGGGGVGGGGEAGAGAWGA